MKKIANFFLLLLLVIVAGCKKDSQPRYGPPDNAIDYNNFTTPIPDDAGCMQRVWAEKRPYIPEPTAGGIDTAIQLFQQNSLSYSNLVFYSVRYDTFGGGNNVTVTADQYVNGIRYFNGEQNYRFINGKLNYANYRAVATTLDTVASLRLGQLRTRFMACVSLSHFAGYTKDSCLEAQFGYYDINGGGSNTALNIVKMWKVFPHNAAYPYAYIKEDGTVVQFNTGLVY